VHRDFGTTTRSCVFADLHSFLVCATLDTLIAPASTQASSSAPAE
jgi:hypothetical protein